MKEFYKPVHKKRLEEVAAHYQISDNAFTAGLDKAIEDTDKLFQSEGVDLAFHDQLDGKACGLVSLAIGDVYSNTSDTSEASNLVYALQSILVTEDKGKIVSFSSRIRNSARKGDKYAQYFHHGKKRHVSQENLAHNELLESSLDLEQTNQVREEFSQWGKGSVLHNVRTTLGLTKSSEKPYEVFVVGADTENVSPDAVAYTTFDDPPVIVFSGSDADYIVDPTSVKEHEYLHSQIGDQLLYGLNRFLFRGADEGNTELKVTNPYYYPEQRNVLTLIEKLSPKIIKKITDTSMGKIPLDTLFKTTIDEFGSDIFVAFTRMKDRPNLSYDPVVNEISNKVLVDPVNVTNLVKKKYGNNA